MPKFTYEEIDNQTIMTVKLEKEEALDSMAMGMLGNNRLKGVLPFTYFQIEEERYLKYNISKMQKLTHYFAGFVTRKKFVFVLSKLGEAIAELADYMLEESALYMDAEYIFVDEEKESCYFMPLPVVGIKKQKSFLKRIIFNLQFSQNENCDYVAKFMSYLNANTFDMKSFQKLMEELKEEPVEIVKKEEPKIREKAIVPTPLQAAVPQIPIAVGPKLILPSVDVKKKKKGLFGLFKEDKKQEKKDIKESKPKKTQKEVKSNKPPKEKKQKNSVNHTAHAYAIPNQKAPQNAPQNTSAAYAETTVLSQVEEGTTVLTANDAAEYYLLRKKNNQQIKIEQQQTVIGKDMQADFCITDNSAISRSHAVILMQNGSLVIKDNNSTNHTFVNDTMISSGQEVFITGNDKIQLADEEFQIIEC